MVPLGAYAPNKKSRIRRNGAFSSNWRFWGILGKIGDTLPSLGSGLVKLTKIPDHVEVEDLVTFVFFRALWSILAKVCRLRDRLKARKNTKMVKLFFQRKTTRGKDKFGPRKIASTWSEFMNLEILPTWQNFDLEICPKRTYFEISKYILYGHISRSKYAYTGIFRRSKICLHGKFSKAKSDLHGQISILEIVSTRGDFEENH